MMRSILVLFALICAIQVGDAWVFRKGPHRHPRPFIVPDGESWLGPPNDVVYPPKVIEHFKGEITQRILNLAIPHTDYQIPLAVLDAKKLEYGRVANHYVVRGVAGAMPCYGKPRLRIGFLENCDLPQVDHAWISTIHAVEVDGILKITKVDKPN